MQKKHYVPTFHFDPEKPCYCGSRIAFGCCCADNSSTKVPHSIKVYPNYLNATECNRFIRFAEKQKKQWLTVVDSKKSTPGRRAEKRDPSRVTQRVQLGKKQQQANEWVQQACIENLRVSAGVQPEWFEPPQLLRYELGGKYGVHADADHYCQDAKQFYRFIDRDFSLLIYLNDNYEGGGLNFKGLGFQYQPKQGDLVIFPSNHIFSHESLPITSGKKYALVSWGTFPGTPRVSPPRSVVRLTTAERKRLAC